jgi:hypothetical protein
MKRTSKKSERRLDVRRSAYGATSCGRALVLGDVVEFEAGYEAYNASGAWLLLSVQPANINLAGLKPEDFGKTWRWIRTGRLPECSETIEVFADGTWRREDVVMRARPNNTFCARNFGVPTPFIAADEGPFWRWPVAEPATIPAPKAAEPELIITLKDHYAQQLVARLDSALAAITSFNSVRTLRTLLVRLTHDASMSILAQAESLKPLRDEALGFWRNIFFASMTGTELLQKENAVMRQNILRLNDCYKEMRTQVSAMFAATKLRDFIKHEIVGANPERVAIWEHLLREWGIINAEAVRLVRDEAKKEG